MFVRRRSSPRDDAAPLGEMGTVTRRAFLLFSTSAAAMLAVGVGRSAWADGAAPVDQPLQTLYVALEEAMRTGSTAPFPQRFDALAPVVDRVFDLETVLRVSVGLRWDTMNADARTRLLKTFRRFTVATYVANFDKYDGERFQVLPGARDSGADRIVGTEIVSGNGDHTRLDYVM